MRIVSDISVTPDFSGLPPNLYHGLVHLTNNAAAVLTRNWLERVRVGLRRLSGARHACATVARDGAVRGQRR